MQNPIFRIKTLVLLVSCFIFFAVLSISTDILAKDPKEQYKKIQRDIETRKEKIERTKKLEHSILGELERINKELNDIQVELKKYRIRLKETSTEIKKVESEVSVNKEKLQTQNEWLKRKLRVMQRYGYSGDVMIMLSTSEDLSQLFRRWRYIKALALYDHTMLESYKNTLKNLNEQENRLKQLHADLKKTEEKIQQNESEVSKMKHGKETLLASARNEKASHEIMLKELKESAKKLLEIIKKSEETISYSATGFHALRGRLPWPVIGKVILPYGTQKDPQFKIAVFRNGIHIKAEEDSNAKAVYKGKIAYSEWVKGYGQLVIINHGDGYHTLYANLSETFHKVGDIIKEQQPIGVVGESGTLTMTNLYFEIRYKGKPLDPLQWLKKR
ncbi:MAG: peptidoglycan DD-metalloendopeptidase family protein [Nitrospiraceae bacterium]|nr:peptidoglycan DD-metalloendopeptidase family protein [Nitrospiraceae bacterium]